MPTSETGRDPVPGTIVGIVDIPMAAPSQAGGYADFFAEMDLVVANSACPSDITPRG
jgi:hypothetical protein